SPISSYDAALRDFVAAVLAGSGGRFLIDVQAFVDSILDCGLYGALSQTLLKFTSPGVPDLYQGQELWDFSLVDPDNRRPVDYQKRKQLLSEVQSCVSSDEGRRALAQQLATNPRDDRAKLLVTWTALEFRRNWPLLEDSEYIPLEVHGAYAAHICAFAWRVQNDATSRTAIIVAPRMLTTLARSTGTQIPCGLPVWQDTTVSLEGLPIGGRYRNLMTGQQVGSEGYQIRLAELLDVFP